MTNNNRLLLAVLASLAIVVAVVLLPFGKADGAVAYGPWTNEGPVVVTHENVAPGTDTETTRWISAGEATKHVTVKAQPAGPFVATGETVVTEDENTLPAAAGENCQWVKVGPVDDDSEDIAAVEAVPGQHYSLKGSSKTEKEGVPATPDVDPSIWQANTAQEPHDNGAGEPVTWYSGTVGVGLHYASKDNNGPNGEGLRDWFYYRAPVEGKDKVEGFDFKWAKECQTPAVAEVSHLDYPWQKQVRSALPDEPETPTETPTVTPPTPTETVTVTPPVPTETVTETPAPETPEVPEEETPESETPVATPNNPDKDKDEPVKPPRSTPAPPKDVQVIACVDGVWTTQVNGETISESGSCVETPENTEFQTFSETGF